MYLLTALLQVLARGTRELKLLFLNLNGSCVESLHGADHIYVSHLLGEVQLIIGKSKVLECLIEVAIAQLASILSFLQISSTARESVAESRSLFVS